MELLAQAEKEYFQLGSWHQVPLLTQDHSDTLRAAQCRDERYTEDQENQGWEAQQAS